MTEVLLFHHALGLTPGVEAFAEDLRTAGHSVVTPDLYDGVTCGSIEEGVAHAGSVGFDVIAESGAAYADGLGDGFVVAGFSLGVLPAQKIAQTAAGVAGAILYHAAIPLGVFGDDWPAAVALQIHMTADDPWAEEDMPVAEELAAAVGGELVIYPGSGHLIADSSAADYDAAQAGVLLERTLAFLGGA